MQAWNDLKRETIGAKNKAELIAKIRKWWNSKKIDLYMCITMGGQATGL